MSATRLAGAVTAAAMVLIGCGGGDSRELPAVVLPALDGSDDLDVGALAGPAVINMWATWCAPCLAELPDFQRVSDEHADVRFVGVDATGAGDDAESISFLADLGVTYEQFVDPDGEFAAEVEVTELPATLVVDVDGNIVFFHQGQVSYDELTGQLAEL